MAPAPQSFLHIEGPCGSSIWPPRCRALTHTAVQAVPITLAGLAPGAGPARSPAGTPASRGEVLGRASQEHSTVYLGARSYCHEKGVKEQGVGAAQGWQSTCLRAAMSFEEEDGVGRSSKPQHSSRPRGQRLPVQSGPLEGPLPDASSQVSSGPRSPGDGARPPAPALWHDGPAPTALNKSAHCSQAAASGLLQPVPASVGASSQFQELQRPSQSQDASLHRQPTITLVSASVTAR